MQWLVVPSLLSLLGCDQPGGDLREWRPSDHSQQAESEATGARSKQVAGTAEAPLPGLEEVTLAAWRLNCTSCHGQLGRGDGPQGRMVKARDLSASDWQASVTDAQLAEVIVKGRGAMPGFPLPPETVANLVRLVRLFNLETQQRGTPSAVGRPAPSAAPSATAAAAPSAPRPGPGSESR